MPRKNLPGKTLDSEIKKMVKAEVNRTLTDELDPSGDNFEYPPEFDTGSEPTPKKDKQLQKILAAFPSEEGYYGKLYFKRIGGKLELKDHIDTLEEVDDVELEVANMVRERGWPNGDYILRIFKRGESGIAKQMVIPIGIDQASKAQPIQSNPSGEQKDPIENLRETAATLKELSVGTTEETQKSVADAFSKGIEVMSKVNKQDNHGPMETISLLKELGLIDPTKKESDSSQTMLKMMIAMKELFQPPQREDPLLTIIKMKEAGLVKLTSEENDPINSLNKLESVIALAERIGGGESKTNTMIEVIKIVSPYIANIIKDVTTAVSKVTDAKLALAGRPTMAGPVVTEMPKPTPLIPSTPEGGIEVTAEIPENKKVLSTEEESLHPSVKDILIAVRTDDKTFYSRLEGIINMFAGPHIMPGLLNGSIPISEFLNHLTFQIPPLKDPKVQPYLEEFIKWKKGQEIPKQKDTEEDPIEIEGVIGICTNKDCQTEYVYNTREDWKSEDRCEICNSPIVLEGEKLPGDNGMSKTEGDV